MLQEMASTPAGMFAVFVFALGSVLFGGMVLAALSSQEFREMLSEMFFGGIKCKSYKQRVKEWIQWHQKEGESDYDGWVWCLFCNVKRYEGFQDRVF